jgi:hypothetical protein
MNDIFEEPKEVLKALFEAQKKAKGLKKDGTNKFAKFDYVSIEEVVSTARELLHEQGLAFFPQSQSVKHENGEAWLYQSYTLFHAPSGESLNLHRAIVVPDANKQSPCQAQGTAESYMLKNTLRELLIIPRFDAKDDLDGHDHSHRTAGNPKARYR